MNKIIEILFDHAATLDDELEKRLAVEFAILVLTFIQSIQCQVEANNFLEKQAQVNQNSKLQMFDEYKTKPPFQPLISFKGNLSEWEKKIAENKSFLVELEDHIKKCEEGLTEEELQKLKEIGITRN